jgi:hypothetical protein
MAPIPISLGSGSNNARFSAAGITRHLNCYVEKQDDTKTNSMVVACDGLTLLTTLGSVGCRAMIEVGPYVVAVYGRNVYRLAADGTSKLIGGFPTSGSVSIRKNRRAYPQVGLVSDGLYYVVDTQSWTISQVSIPGLPPPIGLGMFDGYGILPASKNLWYITSIDDFTTVSLLNFAQAEGDPDEIIAADERDGEVVLFNRDSVEWWQDTGAASFPFARSQIVHIGCLCAGGVHKVDRTLAWIDRNCVVRLMDGYDGKRISDHGIERDIRQADPDTITSTSWTNGGHIFVSWSCPLWTRTYNLTTNNWHDRESYGDTRWRVSHVVKLGTAILAGDYQTGAVYTMSADVYDEAGSPLTMLIQTPPFYMPAARVQLDAIQIDAIAGVGLNSTLVQDKNPVLMLSWSDNGGKVFNTERQLPLGVQGDYLRRCFGTRLGVVPHVGRVFRLKVSASVVKAIQGMYIPEDINGRPRMTVLVA